MSQRVEVGSIVRIVAPGSRTSDGQERIIPAVVIGQWPDGSLQLYCLHFEGSPLLANAVPLETVEMVFSRGEFDAILESQNRRITELENQLVQLTCSKTGSKPEAQHMKFAIADDSR